MPHFITTTGKRCFSLSFSMSLCFFIHRLLFPGSKCFYLLSLIWRVNTPHHFLPLFSFFHLLFLNLSHNTETLSSHRQRIVTAGKYVCCLDLLCWILMSYQTLQEKSFLFFLSGWFAILEKMKMRAQQPKGHFLVLAEAGLLQRILQQSYPGTVTDIYQASLCLCRDFIQIQ